jgi:signal transduction histidine kinase
MAQNAALEPVVTPGSGAAQLGHVGAEIARNALVATGAQFVHVSHFDLSTGLLRTAASAGLHLEPVQRTLAAIQRVMPGWTVEALVFRADINELNRRAYYDGETIAAPIAEVAAGLMPQRLLQIAGAVLGVRFSLICPLLVRGRVAGALSFHTREPPGDPLRHTCEGFARQAALTLENAELLEEGRARAADLRRAHQRTAATEERIRAEIAELLHGPVQTRLLVASHRLGEARELAGRDPEAAAGLIDEVRAQLDALREGGVRAASHVLHPAIVRIGLLPAVRSLVREFENQVPIALEVDDALRSLDDLAERRIPDGLRLAVYRVLQESLANVARHAGAASVEVRLAAADGELRLVVRDDGRGFAPDKMVRGLGLSTIAERVDLAEGSWSVESAPGQGTVVCAAFPLG